MDLRIPCPCGKVLRVGDDQLGSKVKCPACGNRFLVAAPLTALHIPCPCGKLVKVDDDQQGRTVKCSACGNRFLVPESAPKSPRPPISRPKRDRAPKRGILSCLGCLCGLGLVLLAAAATFYFAWLKVANASARAQSTNNLKQIGLAMQSFHDQFKGLPNHAIVHPQTEQPLLSWRVLLLPALREDALYKQIHLDEPWDSQHNKQFWGKMPEVYRLPTKKNDGMTYYQVFHGDGSMFDKTIRPEQRPLLLLEPNVRVYSCKYHLGNIPDGPSDTILVVEAAEPVNWMKPEDIPFDLKGEDKLLPAVGNHYRDDEFLVLFVDGAVGPLRRSIPARTLRNLITPDDGKKVDRTDLGR
ncbi:MAG: DUF1559 domain-containing protein [Planctomycetes bacterium]|nr:DUF1559 domain-containing protein [Planctomycetota bacterium]